MGGDPVFRPKPSYGWFWFGLLALVMILVPLPAVAMAEEVVPLPLKAFMAAVSVLGVFYLFTAACFPLMRYTLTDDALLVVYGPLLRWRLRYGDIEHVEVRTLVPSVWSSARVPGLALWKVPYARLGSIRMCSTRASFGVLLLRVSGRLYGISPHDEERFIAELDRRRAAARAA